MQNTAPRRHGESPDGRTVPESPTRAAAACDDSDLKVGMRPADLPEDAHPNLMRLPPIPHHQPRPMSMSMKKLLLTLGVLAVAASGATATTGRVAKMPAKLPPGVGDDLRKAGAVCVADSGAFRLWWTEVPGAAQTIQGADGNCATVPPVAQESLDALHRGRVAVASLGFRVIAGDSLPKFVFQRRNYRLLVSLSPTRRAALLKGTKRTTRGRVLASFSPAQRRIVNRGLATSLRRALAVDIRRAQRGTAADFVGGDRRIDVTLTANAAFMGERDGYASCLSYPSLFGAYRFQSTSMVVLTNRANADTATLAHELFHVVQCNRGVSNTSDLVTEGSAEWSAAVSDPVGFVGGVLVDPADGQQRLHGGSARAVGFCTSFTPHAGPGLDNYRSFPVWMELEKTQPGTIRNLIAVAVKGVLRSSDATMALIGDARWTTALGAAHQAVCGGMTTPTANMTFPVDTRGYIAANTPTVVSTGGSTSAAVPVGGVTSIGLRWNTRTPVITVSSPQLAPDALATRLVAGGITGPLQVTPTPTGVTITVPPDQVNHAGGYISISSPGLAQPITVAATVS